MTGYVVDVELHFATVAAREVESLLRQESQAALRVSTADDQSCIHARVEAFSRTRAAEDAAAVIGLALSVAPARRLRISAPGL